jgi:hypothetical protein
MKHRSSKQRLQPLTGGWLHYPPPLAAPLSDAFTLHIDLQPVFVLFPFPAATIPYCPSVGLGPLAVLMKLMSLGMGLWVSVVGVPFGGRGKGEWLGEKSGLPASSSSSGTDGVGVADSDSWPFPRSPGPISTKEALVLEGFLRLGR